jgi:hypothetical protein
MVDFGNEAEQRFFLLLKSRAFQIPQDAPHQILAAQQLRRNCGVVPGSKWTLVSGRSEGGDQLPDAGA